MSVEITIRRKTVGLLPLEFKKRKLKQVAGAILKALGQSERELSLLFTEDREIAELNGRYRNKPKPTDVLSFAPSEGCESAVVMQTTESLPLGDIVISVETAIRQAEKFGVSVEDEILRLLIHGALHLLGYEHEKVSADVARRMRKKEVELFAELSALLSSQ